MKDPIGAVHYVLLVVIACISTNKYENKLIVTNKQKNSQKSHMHMPYTEHATKMHLMSRLKTELES